MERRLTTILAADVAEYSRLMGEDETGTFDALKALHRDLIAPCVRAHRGRIVKLMGDGLLSEFASVVEAVKCAVEIQRGLAERNAKTDERRPILLRIGINLGDVIVEGRDIYGDGVNVAARLEAMAPRGGICLSDAVYRHVRSKLDLSVEDLGEKRLKNIAEPVHVYRIVPETAETPIPVDAPPQLPDKPSIAVLPFTNMSGDPQQDYFSDGITEEIITALSKISDLLVVARNSTFIYKGRAVDVKQVSREQGVRYVLEGSVRKAASRVRITAQLIDALSGHHLWAERYDRDVHDIFAVQDEITREIVVALDVRLRWGEMAHFWSSGTKNLEAWELVRRGMEVHMCGTAVGQREAQVLCRKALELDPDYAHAWVMLGWAHHNEYDVGVGYGVAAGREAAIQTATDCARKALELDASNADAHALLAMCHLSKGEFDEALSMSEKAVLLSPNHADNLAISAVIQTKCGRPERALQLIKKAMRLCPLSPAWFYWALGTAYRLTGQGEAAVATYDTVVGEDIEALSIYVGLASTLGELGRTDKAKQAASEILRLKPDFSIEAYMDGLSYRDPSVLSRIEEGLRQAGLPD